MEVKKRITTNTKAAQLGKKKLESSGLDTTDAKQLQIKVLGPQQTARLHSSFKQLCALQLNYLGPDGKPLSDWPKAPPFYRIRYLETPTDFDSLTAKKPIRYTQEPNTAPVAYYPQNFDGWESLCEDPDQPLVITEGELKAAKACKEGFPTLGLGGVYNWRSAKLGLEWLPSLDLIMWVKRHVYVCFDSDYRDNPMVCAALATFAAELQRRGAFTYLVSLPQLPGLEKIGLDDFLVHAGPNAVEQFKELLRVAEPLGLTAPLFSMNDQYVYVRNPGLVIDRTDVENKVSPSAFKEHLEATSQYQERTVKADGSVSYKAVAASAAWLKWPLRTEVAKLTYSPGAKSFLTQRGLEVFNTWTGWGVEPTKGDVKPFLDLVKHLFTGAEKEAEKWFLNWCAYPLQRPGVKLFSSAVVHGIRHGTGKSLIGYTLGRIYGKNFTELNQNDLHNNFNEWAENKQFVMGDDITGSNKRQDADYLKKIITQQELRLNPKHVRSYVVPDCINYYFTANHPDSFFLEDDDRRFFIHEVIVQPLPEAFFQAYRRWLDEGGASFVFDWLLKRDTKGFNPAAPAFRTAAKDRMITNVQSDLAGWVRQLLLTPDQVLKVGEVKVEKDLFTNKELLQFYDPTGHTGTTANGLGRELARAGVRQVLEGRPVRLTDGTQQRYYAVRNMDEWLGAAPKKVQQHLEAEMKPKVRKKKY